MRAFAVKRGELALLSARGGDWQPGQDVAGEVVRAAADGSGPPLGARVAGLAKMAGWAELVAIPAARLAVLPDAVDFRRAAALPMTGTTALNILRSAGPLLGRRALITGASGGVGGFAVQLAALGGARVTAIARSEDAPRPSRNGASEIVPPARPGPRPTTSCSSRSVVRLAAAFEQLAPGGVLVTYGNSSAEATPFDFFAFFGHDDARVQTYFSYRHGSETGAGLAVLLDLLAADRLHVELGATDSWHRLDDALDRLRDRRIARQGGAC